MKPIPPRQFIFGSLFLYANKLQVIGDQLDENITMKQWLLIVMAAQFEEPLTLTALADFLGCSRQNIKKLALRLKEKGFLTLVKDRKDSRALQLLLTTKCLSYYKQRDAQEKQFLNTLFKGFSEDEIIILQSGMNKLGKNIFDMYKIENSHDHIQIGATNES